MGCRTNKINGVEFCMTHHAAERAIDMALTIDDILDVLQNPVETYQSTKYVAMCVRNNEIALAMPVCDKDASGSHRTIVTILPSGVDNWRKAEASGMLGEGRALDEKRYGFKNNY